LYFNTNTRVWREYVGVGLPADTTGLKVVTLGKEKKYLWRQENRSPLSPLSRTMNSTTPSCCRQALRGLTWILYIVIVIFIITAVSNGANLTDGLDGLATGTSALIGACLGIFAYASGNIRFAEYLNIMYIPNLGELSIFIGALIGACVGFLWYNAYPAQVFMGDTGSLTLGGIIAALAIIVRKEWLIPIFCGVFLVESLSVVIQVSYFKYTKKKKRRRSKGLSHEPPASSLSEAGLS
jgi:phospho-N-acetylmuramoyl-pentapeptide-transferase